MSRWRGLSALVRLAILFRYEQFDLAYSMMPKTGLLAMLAGDFQSYLYIYGTSLGCDNPTRGIFITAYTQGVGLCCVVSIISISN